MAFRLLTISHQQFVYIRTCWNQGFQQVEILILVPCTVSSTKPSVRSAATQLHILARDTTFLFIVETISIRFKTLFRDVRFGLFLRVNKTLHSPIPNLPWDQVHLE